jgi:16S rRNA (cytidine1402-2'-O)-methyltransferase
VINADMTSASKSAAQRPETGGTLFVTGTPIGNLQDISERVKNVLSSVDLVAAEDTRRTRNLLSHLGISVRLISCREQNEAAGTEKILDALGAGGDVAFVTDAGMPALSDPGRRAVHIVRSHGYRIVPVPGPSAVTTALSVSGMPADRFHFEGFLPSKQAARRRRLEELASLECTLVFFEAPHRLKATLADMERHLGDRETFMARELTKLHETLISSKLSVLREMVSQGVRGEITLVVSGAAAGPPHLNGVMKDSLREILTCLLFPERLSTRNACTLLSSLTGISRNSLYSMALEVKNERK